jgi:NAD-dependent SIR2 family protein deacetylase
VAGQEDERVAECCGTAQVNQCYRCHQTTSWNDILGVGYYKIH